MRSPACRIRRCARGTGLVGCLMDILMLAGSSIGRPQTVLLCLLWLKTCPLMSIGNLHRLNAIHWTVDTCRANNLHMNCTASPRIHDRSVSIRWNNRQPGDGCMRTDLTMFEQTKITFCHSMRTKHVLDRTNCIHIFMFSACQSY